jgi:tripartite-type tricarboxylate transporter receptor subunit TctC
VGSSGHLALEMIKRMGKVDIRHVPYKGASQANNDLLGGQIDLSADNLPTALPLIKAGKLVALGVTSAQPVAAAPGVAAIAQSVPGFELTSWFVVMAPAGTPQPVIDKLNAAAQRVLDAPATRERLAALAAQPMGGTPQALAQHLQTEREKYRVLIEGTDIRPE